MPIALLFLGVTLLVVIGLCFPRPVLAKRMEPKAVEPLVADGIRYEAPAFGTVGGKPFKGGHVQAFDAATSALLWDVVVYKTVYNPLLESDVQDVFITKLLLEEGMLRVENEKKKVFYLDPKTGEPIKNWRVRLNVRGEKGS